MAGTARGEEAMANRTDPSATTIHGTNPQNLIEKIIRDRIYTSRYWKEECFGLTGTRVPVLAGLCANGSFFVSWVSCATGEFSVADVEAWWGGVQLKRWWTRR